MCNENENNKYDVMEMIKLFAEDERLRKFLEEYKIAKVSEVNFKKYFNKNDNRCTSIIDAQEEFFNHSTKILIDLRFGQPSVTQVYDALYDIGGDCDIKVIIYTDDYNYKDKGTQASSKQEFELAEKEAMKNLMKSAISMSANAIIDLKLSTGTYQQQGSKWEVSQAVYIGTAIRIN